MKIHAFDIFAGTTVFSTVLVAILCAVSDWSWWWVPVPILVALIVVLGYSAYLVWDYIEAEDAGEQ